MTTAGLKNPDTQARFRAQAQVLKALAHPTRLFLLEALSRQEHNVRDLTDMVGAEMSTVSKHLANSSTLACSRTKSAAPRCSIA